MFILERMIIGFTKCSINLYHYLGSPCTLAVDAVGAEPRPCPVDEGPKAATFVETVNIVNIAAVKTVAKISLGFLGKCRQQVHLELHPLF